jgi:hypothetical protein
MAGKLLFGLLLFGPFVGLRGKGSGQIRNAADGVPGFVIIGPSGPSVVWRRRVIGVAMRAWHIGPGQMGNAVTVPVAIALQDQMSLTMRVGTL